jgi:two-component system, NtrC family, response regulator PilR
VRRVGGNRDLPVAARILAATNRDLAIEVEKGRFREDLYYRLNVIQLRLPPLRERREDVPAFLEHFLARFGAEYGRQRPRLSPDAERLLLAHDWPGNVRELANVVERAIALSESDLVDVPSLPPNLRGRPEATGAGSAPKLPEAGIDLQAHLDAVERALIEQALARTGGVKTEAAHLLSLTFRSLRYRLAKYGMRSE